MKKEKKSKRSSSGKHKKDKSLYEVADGVATPSKEHISGTATPNNMVTSPTSAVLVAAVMATVFHASCVECVVYNYTLGKLVVLIIEDC